MLAAEGTSMGRNHAEALQSSFKDALAPSLKQSCTQQDFVTAFRNLDEYHNKLYDNFLKTLQDVYDASLDEFENLSDRHQIPAQLARVSALSESRGIVPRPFNALQAMATHERLAAKQREKEHLKRIFETATQEQDALSGEVERRKSAAASLRADIAAMGEEYREVQGKDSRWRSRNLLSM